MDWKSILFTLGPILLPKIISYARAFYATVRSSSGHVRPLPADAQRGLNILFASAAACLALSLPLFAPENIFAATDARLQTSNDVLFARLRAVREAAGLPGLTPSDLVLKDRLQTRDGRFLYLQYGPDTLSTCPFCTTDSPSSFLVYALPLLAAPHLVHLVALGLATSATLAGRDAASWRTRFGLAGLGLAALDFIAVYRHDPAAANAGALRAADLAAFFWTVRPLRYLGLALADAALAGLLWLSATRRAFWSAGSRSAERLEAAAKLLEAQGAKVGALGALRNAVMRDRGLRVRVERYWTEEAVVMAEVDQDEEVVEGLRGAALRLDVPTVDKRAEELADQILGALSVGSASAAAG